MPIRTIASADIVAPSLSNMSLALVAVELSKSYLTFVIFAVDGIAISTDGRTGKLIFFKVAKNITQQTPNPQPTYQPGLPAIPSARHSCQQKQWLYSLCHYVCSLQPLPLHFYS